MALVTDFIKIARAGNTVDGRVIREDWLKDMAATYDPKTYTALIWPEHMRWSGNYGEVAELKADKDESGALCLFARLRPNYLLLWQNAAAQKLFYSIEVRENFADSGKAYLEGLAVTDSPASLGMESTRFSARKQHPDTIFIGNVGVEPLAGASDGALPGRRSQRGSAYSDEAGRTGSPADIFPAAGAEEVAPGWFRRLFPNLFTTTEDSDMDKKMEERLKALEDTFAALGDQVQALSGRVEAFAANLAKDASGAAEKGAAGNDAGKDAADRGTSGKGEAFAGQAEFEALKGNVDGLRKDVSAFMDELRNTVRPGTKAGENSAPAEGGAGLL